MTSELAYQKPVTSQIAYLGLGSNLGDRESNIQRALQQLDRHPEIAVQQVSANLPTAPAFFEAQPEFLNACACVQTTLSPAELLNQLLETELALGRVRTMKNGPRTIDLDLLFYADWVFLTEDLQVPHPGVQERDFVMIPLVEIAPEYVHPVIGETITALLAKRGPSANR